MLESGAVAPHLTPTDTEPAARLLAWYDRQYAARRWRDMPWRAAPAERPDPYHVWLSEIMLQQTTVATVGPYFRRFLKRWPSLADLAQAPLDQVLHAWQGLGYYARGRNLHACACRLMAEHGGCLPDSEAALRRLPGIGPYTAAAIQAIAFDRPANVVDGNVERVMARLFAIETPLPAAKPKLAALAGRLVPPQRAGDYAQALMDLGATVCAARRATCEVCPWAGDCHAHAAGQPERLPRRTARAARPHRHGVAFWLTRGDGAILLRRRPERGLLGGMVEVPSTPWREQPWRFAEARAHAPTRARWRCLTGAIGHGFTHFTISFDLFAAAVTGEPNLDGFWVEPADFPCHALPTLTKKIIAHASSTHRRARPI